HLVAIRTDADTTPELVETWGVDRLPTAVLISTDGSVLGKIEGYRPAEKYLSELTALLGASKQSTTPEADTRQARPAQQAESADRPKPQLTPEARVELAARTVK